VAVPFFGIPACRADELRFAIDGARDPLRLIARISLETDRVVAVDLARASLDAAPLRTAAGRGGSEGAPVAHEHDLPVDRARVRPRLAARIRRRAERRIAMQVATVDNLAFVRTPAIAPQRETTLFAHERLGVVGGARVVDWWVSRTRVAFDSKRVVAIVAVAAPRATALSAARHFYPRSGIANDRPVGSGANELVLNATPPARRGAATARRGGRQRRDRQQECEEACLATGHVAVDRHPDGARLKPTREARLR
jgi:hypothetical protein